MADLTAELILGAHVSPPNSPDPRIKVVYTGHPLVALLACTRCGVLLWDSEKHWADAHPEVTDG